ncbi:MAG: hypothetical protein HY824_15530 [Acidobacteria bacterium]|nr:hypothetical protein [Acidobacteriota bacterium]
MRFTLPALVLFAVVLPACSSVESSTDAGAVAAAAAEPAAPASSAALALTYDRPAVVGARVRAAASGLPPRSNVELQWGTVAGGWVIEDYYHFRGRKFSETTTSLGRFDVDAGGRLDAAFTIPEDYGGVHEITALVNGTPVAHGGIEVTQTFDMTPRSGPVGTLVEVKVTGLGWRTMENTWVVNWDNHNAGFVSAVTTRGSGVARVRAAGPAGDHVVKLLTAWQGQGYLNYEQSPVAHLPRPQFVFRTTPGRTATPAAYAEPYQRQPVPETDVSVPGAKVALSATQGPVGTRVVLRGQGFAPGTAVQLVWGTSEGNRVADGFAPVGKDLTRATVRGDGTLEMPIAVPEDLGGLHDVSLRAGDKTLARAHFVIETSVVGITPLSGPAGTPVTIHLKGVGWTEYDNIYVATYDNAYMGYACGFNSQGDVVINFTASGAPGVHIIDLYPGIYQGPATEVQQLYRLPQLTYADDHPGNRIPALRFMFEVTPSPALATR